MFYVYFLVCGTVFILLMIYLAYRFDRYTRFLDSKEDKKADLWRAMIEADRRRNGK
jgi:cell division protein FtsW (lipid II flippase)